MAILTTVGSEPEETERAETDTGGVAAFQILTRTWSRRKETFDSMTNTTPTRETMSATDAEQKSGEETEDKPKRRNIPELPDHEG